MLRRYWRAGLAVLVYLLVALFAFSHLWGASAPATQANSGPDPGQSIWFLSYWAWSLVHGHPTLSTALVNEPHGFNLIDNPSIAFPALLVLPVTLLAGPMNAYYTAVTIALAGSGVACYALIRRLTRWWGAALIGGLAFEISPYMVGQASQHIHLAFVAIPPLIALVLYELCAPRTSLRPEILGLILAGLTIAQFFTSSEVLDSTAVMAVVTLVVAALVHLAARRPFGAIAERVGRAGAVCVVVAGGVLAYPVWYAISGPQHVHGLASPPVPFRADLAGIVVPTSLQALAPAAAVHMSSHFVEGNLQENGSYLGVPLVLVCIIGAIWLRRRPVAKVTAVTMAVAFVLSLGSSLTVTGSTVPPGHGWLPGRLLYHLPLGSDVIAVRFSMYTALGAVVLLALVLDQLRVWVAERTRIPVVRDLSTLAVAAVCLIPLVPEWPYRTQPVPVPAFFTSSAVRSIAPGTNVLLYPYPALAVDVGAPMVWQAESFMRFRIVGGYYESGDNNPFYTRYTRTYLTLQSVYVGLPPTLTHALRAEIFAEMQQARVTMILADPSGPAGPRGVAFLTALVGRAPARVGGVAIWRDVSWR
ncbi:MAG: hypothetical protein M0Z30_22435 [Actinomycetota bacterium]|nr:hypothetical protein [Actinomycetota bacterium]